MNASRTSPVYHELELNASETTAIPNMKDRFTDFSRQGGMMGLLRLAVSPCCAIGR